MEGTGHGRRMFSAGLLGVMLATAGLLAIVLLDSRPALAEPGEAGIQTDTESPLDGGGDTRSEVPSELQTQPPTVGGSGGGEFEALQQLGGPLAATLSTPQLQLAEASLASDHPGEGRQATAITPPMAQVRPLEEQQPQANGLQLDQDDPEGHD